MSNEEALTFQRLLEEVGSKDKDSLLGQIESVSIHLEIIASCLIEKSEKPISSYEELHSLHDTINQLRLQLANLKKNEYDFEWFFSEKTVQDLNYKYNLLSEGPKKTLERQSYYFIASVVALTIIPLIVAGLTQFSVYQLVHRSSEHNIALAASSITFLLSALWCWELIKTIRLDQKNTMLYKDIIFPSKQTEIAAEIFGPAYACVLDLSQDTQLMTGDVQQAVNDALNTFSEISQKYGLGPDNSWLILDQETDDATYSLSLLSDETKNTQFNNTNTPLV